MTQRRTRRASAVPEDQQHSWVGAAYVPIPPNLIRQANQRGSIRMDSVSVAILEVYCEDCRRAYAAALVDQPCPSRTGDRAHLIGGPSADKRPEMREVGR